MIKGTGIFQHRKPVQLTPMVLKPPTSDEVAHRVERGGMGQVIHKRPGWYLFWLRVDGKHQWQWHRARLQMCERVDVGPVPMAMAECTGYKHGDHVWHGPFTAPVADVVALSCPPCVEQHNALVRAQRGE